VQIHGCLNGEEARKYIEVAESRGFTHQGSRGPKYGEAFRNHYRYSTQDEGICKQLWEATGLCHAVKGLLDSDQDPLGLNPNIRIYKYGPGDRFGTHVDDSQYVDDMQGWTRYTLLVYLSDTQGGETVFYNDRGRLVARIAPRTGLAVFHKHGDECLEHEAMPVVQGIKYVLRSDVVFSSSSSL